MAVRVKRHIEIKERIILTASLQQQELQEKLKETNSPLDSSHHWNYISRTEVETKPFLCKQKQGTFTTNRLLTEMLKRML